MLNLLLRGLTCCCYLCCWCCRYRFDCAWIWIGFAQSCAEYLPLLLVTNVSPPHTRPRILAAASAQSISIKSFQNPSLILSTRIRIESIFHPVFGSLQLSLSPSLSLHVLAQQLRVYWCDIIKLKSSGKLNLMLNAARNYRNKTYFHIERIERGRSR